MVERTLAGIEKDLREAHQALQAAQEEERAANRNCCNALNRVNGLQNEFDMALGKLQRLAPADSHWHNTYVRGKGQPA